MSIKKLSLAATISIGLLAFGTTAFAEDQANQPTQDLSAASATCPSNVAGATKDIERQVYAYPSISDRNLVIPTDNQIIQIGANDQKMRDQENITGAAAPLGADSGMAVTVQGKQGISVSKGLTDRLSASESINMQTASSTPLTKMVQVMEQTTGAAAPVTNQFSDVASDFWANQDINRLASSGTVAGYPDRSFKPYLPISRAEFASMLVNGLNLSDSNAKAHIYKDVPVDNWANSNINKASSKGLMVGYNENIFKPQQPITRAEALNILGKNVPGQLTISEAMNILGSYSDGKDVPTWAKLNVAQALNSGINKDLPDNNMILPNKDTTRAEASSMMLKLRQTLALEPSVTGAAAPVMKEVTVQLPTMKIKFNGLINARSSKIGDHFSASTLEPLTINGLNFPSGSKVSGKIVEVIRPSIESKGAIKIELNSIAYKDKSSPLPREILSVKMEKTKNQNIASRIITFPFTATGKVVGTIGRTLGSGLVIAGNSTEGLINGVGHGAGEVFTGKFADAGRSTLDGAMAFGQGLYDFGKTGVSGTVGLLGDSGQELSYVISPEGTAITAINPGDEASVAFGCGQ